MNRRHAPPAPLEQGSSFKQSRQQRFLYVSHLGFVPNRPVELSFSYLMDTILAFVLTHAFMLVGAAAVGLLFVLILHLAGVIRVF